MKDAVALAWSGRVEEAQAAAEAQVAAEDPFVASQGLEALAVLGEQQGLRASPEVAHRLEVWGRTRDGGVSRRAFEAAGALGSLALEAEAVRRLVAGQADWAVLRYVGERPTHRLAQGLASGWEGIDPALRDQALLTTRTLPVASQEENDAWGERVARFLRDEADEVRGAAFQALAVWRPPETADLCVDGLGDEAGVVRRAAAQALLSVDVERFVVVMSEREPFDLEVEVPPQVQRLVDKAREGRR